MASFFKILFLCFSTFVHFEAKPTQNADQQTNCDQIVREGRRAQITFPVEPRITVAESFAVNIRRSDGSDVANCDRKSPIKCTAPKHLWTFYKVEFVNNAFILSITNATKDFDDTYTLDAFANDTHQMRLECRIVVKGNESCAAPAVDEGTNGEVRFVFGVRPRPGDSFRVNIRRAHNHDDDIVVCNNPRPSCTVVDKRYETSGVVNNSLSLWIPRASPHMEDSYMLQTTINGLPSFPISCIFRVNVQDPQHEGHCDTMPILITVSAFSVFIIIGIVFLTTIITNLKKEIRRRCPIAEEIPFHQQPGVEDVHQAIVSKNSVGSSSGYNTDNSTDLL